MKRSKRARDIHLRRVRTGSPGEERADRVRHRGSFLPSGAAPPPRRRGSSTRRVDGRVARGGDAAATRIVHEASRRPGRTRRRGGDADRPRDESTAGSRRRRGGDRPRRTNVGADAAARGSGSAESASKCGAGSGSGRGGSGRPAASASPIFATCAPNRLERRQIYRMLGARFGRERTRISKSARTIRPLGIKHPRRAPRPAPPGGLAATPAGILVRRPGRERARRPPLGPRRRPRPTSDATGRPRRRGGRAPRGTAP